MFKPPSNEPKPPQDSCKAWAMRSNGQIIALWVIGDLGPTEQQAKDHADREGWEAVYGEFRVIEEGGK